MVDNETSNLKRSRSESVDIPVSTCTGGVWPGIDINSAELFAIMEGEIDA